MVPKTIRKKKTNETVKQELLNSLKENDDLEEPGLDETAYAIMHPLEAVRITNPYKETIKTQNKRAIGYVGKQGQLLKNFKETENVFENVGQIKSKIYFKIGLYKFLKKSTLSFQLFEEEF